MQKSAATIVGVFSLGLAVGAFSAPWLPGIGGGGEGRIMAILIEELEADVGVGRVQAALARARMRIDLSGLY